MQHLARLNQAELAPGAILSIDGSSLYTDDVLEIRVSNGVVKAGTVAAFGLGRLKLRIADSTIDLRPWRRDDGDVDEFGWPVSNWTIVSVASPAL